jgi:hypothetical protein
MRNAWGCLCLCALILTPCAKAEPPALLASPDAPQVGCEQPPSTFLIPADSAVAPAAAPGMGLQHVVDAKFLFGFPTGLRLQMALDRQETRAWMAEVFAGFELFNPTYGCGGRLLLTPATGKACDALVIGPGLNFFYFVGDHSSGEHWFTSSHDGYFVVPDVEVAWVHDFANHFGFELGLDLGLGVAFWQGDQFQSARVSVLPLLSAYTGFNF